MILQNNWNSPFVSVYKFDGTMSITNYIII